MKIPPRFEKAQWDDVPPKVKEVVEAFHDKRRGLFLHGGVGSGKTHIAFAIGRHCAEKKIDIKFWNSVELMNRIRDSYGNRYEGDFLDEILAFKGLLIIDDIGAEKLTEWVAEQFYLIINRKYQNMIPIVLTSNYGLQELSERLGERIASRLVEMCEIFELTGGDRRLS